VFGVGVLALFGTVSLIGPLVVRLLGTAMVRAARGPAVLLAAGACSTTRRARSGRSPGSCWPCSWPGSSRR
jgi:hypothetical protein